VLYLLVPTLYSDTTELINLIFRDLNPGDSVDEIRKREVAMEILNERVHWEIIFLTSVLTEDAQGETLSIPDSIMRMQKVYKSILIRKLY
jgi:hypothetical protein